MNEPNIRVALVLPGVGLVAPLVHALLIAESARRVTRTNWTVWIVGFVIVAAAVWTVAPEPANSGDTKFYISLTLWAGVATALAAWIVDRKQRRGTVPLWRLAPAAATVAAFTFVRFLLPGTC